MQNVFIAYATQTLDDIGVDPATFNYLETNQGVMTYMAGFAASHWMDESLFTEFWMKNYDEVQGHGRYDQLGQIGQQNLLWGNVIKARNAPDAKIVLSDNMVACIRACLDNWSYGSVMEQWDAPTYRWGLTHGDFHPGQLMVDPSDLNEMVIADFEFAGVMGSPVIDLVTWVSGQPNTFLVANEQNLVQTYWKGLIQNGVDYRDYAFEQLWEDYQVQGAAQLIARYGLIAGFTPEAAGLQALYTMIDDFLTRNDMTPDRMKAPVYGAFDLYV